MERTSQVYMGVPNGIVLCVDESDKEHTLTARMSHAYRADDLEITSIEQMLPEMEALFDEIRFPQKTTNYRSFTADNKESAAGRSERTVRSYTDAAEKRVRTDDDLLDLSGRLATFIIRVQHRQNSDWQGRMTWAERDRTVGFRTVSEMFKLIYSALDAAAETEGE